MFKIIVSLLISALASFILFLMAFIASILNSEVGVSYKLHTPYPIPLPKHVSESNTFTYQQELDMFSDQLVRAFNISKGQADRYTPVIMQADINTGLSEIKIASLIMTESSFREDVSSNVGAYGSTQIRAIFWENFCKERGYDMFDFEGNILCGSEILVYLMGKYCEDDILCGLQHYNVGRTNLRTSLAYRQAGKRYTKKIEYYTNKMIQDVLEY